MFAKLKKFASEYQYEIIVVTGIVVTAALVITRTKSPITKGTSILEIPNSAVKELQAGKEILVDCFADAYLHIKPVPKI